MLVTPPCRVSRKPPPLLATAATSLNRLMVPHPRLFSFYASPSLPAREGDQRFAVGVLDAVGKAGR